MRFASSAFYSEKWVQYFMPRAFFLFLFFVEGGGSMITKIRLFGQIDVASVVPDVRALVLIDLLAVVMPAVCCGVDGGLIAWGREPTVHGA